MNYKETLDWMFAQLPMYHREGKAAYKANLDNTLALDAHFGSPHRRFRTIHVAGTNGKGSVSHMLASILQETGLRVGLYTSPHLKDFRERIRVNGQMISQEYVTHFVESNQEIFDRIHPSFFEMTVAMAFQYFADAEVDIAVIEVGLGGRLDSTNIITPLVSVITNIALDHVALLGDTLEKIAGEKAGIIKPGVPAVVGIRDSATDFVFEQRAREVNTSVRFASDLWHTEHLADNTYNFTRQGNQWQLLDLHPELHGFYQRKNIPTVLETIQVLREQGLSLPDQAVRQGIERVVTNTGLLGRWQVLSERPYTVCDTGHNVDGITEVVSQLLACHYDHLHIVLGMVNDKDIDGVLALLPRDATYYFCKASIPRAMDEHTLADKASRLGLHGHTYPTVAEAYHAAKAAASPLDMIYIGGSTFVVAEVL